MYSLPFIILPYLLGILTAIFNDGYELNIALSLLGFIPLVLNHLAANLQSDIYDYHYGIDKEAHSLSGAVVRKWVSMKQASRVVIFMYMASIIAGSVMVMVYGAFLLPFIVLGILLSVFYSAGGRMAFKYNVTGEWFIFLGFGILIPLYGYFLNAREFSFAPVLYALPAAWLIAAIKHANNWMSILSPANRERQTAASLMGHKASRIFYYLLIILPYVTVVLMIAWRDVTGFNLPASFILTYLTLPLTVVLMIKARDKDQIDPANRYLALDSMTAALYCLFIALCCASVIVG
jgi:1,4-dihydroxy-2-naphthoate octaprenyltransferase